MAGGRLTILVSGMIAGDPYQGGATWAVLQYLLGFRRLGHEVYFVEPVAETALRPAGATLSVSTNADYFLQVVREFGLEGKAALLLAETHETAGLDHDQLRRALERADMLVHISGMPAHEAPVGRLPR